MLLTRASKKGLAGFMKYMVTMQLNLDNEQSRSDMRTLLVQEQIHVQQLMDRGIIETQYISNERAFAWLVMYGIALEQIERELSDFPLYPYTEYKIKPLVAQD